MKSAEKRNMSNRNSYEQVETGIYKYTDNEGDTTCHRSAAT